MFTEQDFWQLIADCRKKADDDLLAYIAAWELALGHLDQEDFHAVEAYLLHAVAELSDWKTFSAAWLFSNGDRDDFFPRFTEWVIAHGEAMFRNVKRNPDSIPQHVLIKGRWDEHKISSVVRHVAAKHFGGTLVLPSDRALWQPLLEKTGFRPTDDATNSAVASHMKQVCPLQPQVWATTFPHLHGFVEQRRVPPEQDRRTPMTAGKFWLLVEEARKCHDSSRFLTYSLQNLPVVQIVDFDTILDDLLSKIQASVLEIKANDPSLSNLSDEELGGMIVVMGQEIYNQVCHNPSSWEAVREKSVVWKGQRIRQAARQAFFQKTGHAEPIVA